MNRVILSAPLMLLLIASLAQGQCRIRIEATDTLPFLFSINETVVNQVPVLSVTLDQDVEGKVKFKADFPFRPELSFTQMVTLAANTSVTYSIERSKGNLKFIVVSESEMIFPYPANDSNTTINSMDTIVAHTGCFPVVDDGLYEDMLSEVGQQHFEAKKLSILSSFASEECLRTEQLRTMMGLLTQEDNKIALLMAAKDQIYDPEQLPEVANDFFMARNKVKAKEIIDAGR